MKKGFAHKFTKCPHKVDTHIMEILMLGQVCERYTRDYWAFKSNKKDSCRTCDELLENTQWRKDKFGKKKKEI